ncbi:GlmU family protein [Cytophagales bacterium LB-30]|uniref:GlmU family protein n=1 Tax=Shiella aurantiaca TaxID=3058365 RepID=A0ABT8F238_9BACT|nr:GlmU family protein [Shiella aurantiaca]MDN4164517.1 GlmU family protein [Shiella aurantiaca]
MHIILFDDPTFRINLLPFTYTRPVGAIRVGIVTLQEKWAKQTLLPVSFYTEAYLQKKYPMQMGSENVFINASLLPNATVWKAIQGLQPGEALKKEGVMLAARVHGEAVKSFDVADVKWREVAYAEEAELIRDPWDIFSKNAAQIRYDFAQLTQGRKSAGVNDRYTMVYGEENIFVEEGADIKAAVLNASEGPIYIGKNAQVQEGALIKGPFALCEGSVVNMGGKMRGDTTVGPYSKVGGEISNSVIFGYSNKGHDGFLGNSVIGEWCNLGADTNTSNLKNNYANVKLWSYSKKGFKDTGLQFCGLMMGDHSKCGINTMFNTGTVVGVSANVFGDGFPRNFIPSFAWGGAAGFTGYQLKAAMEVAERVMARRKKMFDETEQEILSHVFELSAEYRKF